MVCAVWDLLLEQMIQLQDLKFGISLGCSCPEIMELGILREVRRVSGRIMTLDFSRGDFGDMEGRIGKDAGPVELLGLQEQPSQSLRVTAVSEVHLTAKCVVRGLLNSS